MRIAVVGTGYVGLVAGVCFADSGHAVVCVDIDEEKIAALRQGRSPIYEPGLDELLRKNIAAERIAFSTRLAEAVRASEVVFIAVGTPQGDDGNADLRAAMGVAHEVASVATGYMVVVNKSTVPVGTAELTKYAANAMLAARISFINEVAMLCERVGADVDSVRKAMGSDERIGQKFLFPGCGYGGSCFPKDVKALIATARNHGLDFTLLSAVDAVNDRQKRLLAQKAKAHFGAGNLRGKKFGVWGLAFKPKTDDLRHAPALALIDELLAAGAVVSVHDPVAMDNARGPYGDRIHFVNNPYLAVDGADALFLVTEWNEFRQPDFVRIKAAMKQPVLFDGRNIWNAQRLRELGFAYYGVGRAA